MIDTAVQPISLESLEAALREELAKGEAVSETVVPVLRHLLANDANSLFSEEVIARVRGMLADLARQLLDRLYAVGGDDEGQEHDPAEIGALNDVFIGNPAFVAYLHALAIEWQLTKRLQARHAMDAVVSPLLQALIASTDEGTSGRAMRFLAAQARFTRSQERMQLPLYELPGDLLHNALVMMRTLAGTEAEIDERAAQAESQIRAGYDEAATRLGLLSRLVEGMGSGATAALAVAHAGVPLFLTALAIGSGQDREAAVMATDEAQVARFALALRAAGLKQKGIEEQLLALHPEISLPEGFERLSSDRAAAILSIAGFQRG